MKRRIHIQHLSKKFNIGFHKNLSTLSRFIYTFSGQDPKRELWALRDISLEVFAGEKIGLMGSNGSGKSTLLSTIAGVYKKDSGSISTTGKIISIIGLNYGLRDRLTMKDNIYLSCSLFGLTKREIDERLDDIVNFTGIQDYLYTKIYQFSSGMVARLVFSLAIHCNPDILLLDEAIGPMDQSYIDKIIEKTDQMSTNGMTLIIVSHDTNMLKHCDKVIWLEKGVIRQQGNPDTVIKKYLKTKPHQSIQRLKK